MDPCDTITSWYMYLILLNIFVEIDVYVCCGFLIIKTNLFDFLFFQAAQNAQKDSQELFQAMFFQDRDPQDEACIVDAVIQNLRNNGILAYIPR